MKPSQPLVRAADRPLRHQPTHAPAYAATNAATRAVWAMLLAITATTSHASNCDAIRTQIDAKIKARGVTNYSLSIVGTEDKVPGKVVGNCELGKKKIVYLQGERSEAILTECKDGSSSVGGECKK